MFPKPTPAEKRIALRDRYRSELKARQEVMGDYLRTLVRYVGAVNAGFVIGAGGFIASLAGSAEVPSLVVAIFIMGLVGIFFGGLALVGIVGLTSIGHDHFKSKWHRILHQNHPFVEARIKPPGGEPSFSQSFREAVLINQESNINFIDALIGGRDGKIIKVPRAALMFGAGVQYSLLSAMLNFVFALIAVLIL